jgi:hypothetical protein
MSGVVQHTGLSGYNPTIIIEPDSRASRLSIEFVRVTGGKLNVDDSSLIAHESEIMYLESS